jgi:5S rRNA maturation endonuclease (ribonuclease M5)
MDVIGCHQAGYEAAVAPLGTAMTSDQCHLLKRYVDQVTLLFDADRAGDSAAQRGSELLLEYGFLPSSRGCRRSRMPTSTWKSIRSRSSRSCCSRE